MGWICYAATRRNFSTEPPPLSRTRLSAYSSDDINITARWQAVSSRRRSCGHVRGEKKIGKRPARVNWNNRDQSGLTATYQEARPTTDHKASSSQVAHAWSICQTFVVSSTRRGTTVRRAHRFPSEAAGWHRYTVEACFESEKKVQSEAGVTAC